MTRLGSVVWWALLRKLLPEGTHKRRCRVNLTHINYERIPARKHHASLVYFVCLFFCVSVLKWRAKSVHFSQRSFRKRSKFLFLDFINLYFHLFQIVLEIAVKSHGAVEGANACEVSRVRSPFQPPVGAWGPAVYGVRVVTLLHT